MYGDTAAGRGYVPRTWAGGNSKGQQTQAAPRPPHQPYKPTLGFGSVAGNKQHPRGKIHCVRRSGIREEAIGQPGMDLLGVVRPFPEGEGSRGGLCAPVCGYPAGQSKGFILGRSQQRHGVSSRIPNAAVPSSGAGTNTVFGRDGLRGRGGATGVGEDGLWCTVKGGRGRGKGRGAVSSGSHTNAQLANNNFWQCWLREVPPVCTKEVPDQSSDLWQRRW